jgi:hypothetical protein
MHTMDPEKVWSPVFALHVLPAGRTEQLSLMKKVHAKAAELEVRDSVGGFVFITEEQNNQLAETKVLSTASCEALYENGSLAVEKPEATKNSSLFAAVCLQVLIFTGLTAYNLNQVKFLGGHKSTI